MRGIEVAMTIRRPRREVAAVMFNPRFDQDWIGGVRQARPLRPGPLYRGARVERTARRFGRARTGIVEVLDFTADLRITLDSVPPFGLRVQYSLEGIPEGTIARIRACGSVRGLWGLLAPLLHRQLRAAALRDLERLKALVESGIARRAA